MDYNYGTYENRIGSQADFDRARTGLMSWAAHVGNNVRIYPANKPVEIDSTFLAILNLGPIQVIAPCRIVFAVDEAKLFGFAYGTLDGHPECGEERFVVELRNDGTYFRITSFSRPANVVMRIASPVASPIQRIVNRGYIGALAKYVNE